MPFHTELDDQRFEQFCTDFLNLDPEILCLHHEQATTRRIVGATRALSGTAQKGIDIKADAEQWEVWFFQCKLSKEFLPAQVSKAINLAEEAFPHADQFVLVTTCGLSLQALQVLHNPMPEGGGLY